MSGTTEKVFGDLDQLDICPEKALQLSCMDCQQGWRGGKIVCKKWILISRM